MEKNDSLRKAPPTPDRGEEEEEEEGESERREVYKALINQEYCLDHLFCY